MGGIGSGKWTRTQRRKANVDESLTLEMRDFRDHLHSRVPGMLRWTWASGNVCTIRYSVEWGDPPIIWLRYRWGDSEDVDIPIYLQTTPTPFGGERWWFTCPLGSGDVACDRRVGKLHLPPGARYFGCRECHNLSYRSTQEAHRSKRGTGSLKQLEKLMARLREQDDS